MAALFGPAGTSQSFSKMGYKSYKDIPAYLASFSLNAYEYQCGHGIRIKDETASDLGNIAARSSITLSLHAPYYISLSSISEETRQKSVGYILQSARIANLMQAKRIVVHTGSCGKITRQDALLLAQNTLKEAITTLKESGLGHIHICPETMGKINQLGTLEEVVQLCTLDEILIPCIDFGHLNARTFGAIQNKQDYLHILETIENCLGSYRARHFHCHFSKIEFTLNGGEKRHLTFNQNEYGPDFEPFLEVLAQKNAQPTIICESAGTQAEDAQIMKKYYESLL